ncbi:MAG: prephenate dehydrogenase/arogenate dehydrogenase family protein [Nitrososphaerota archaeon]|nr:prephenate dehydrogenase/arogenate dehydrogenase family protein [Candidatus Calditenuaceae archaeon]MDW8072834.1 prephenate dehydrogenase/arogenate dehydrogenase family protein [Nitrososphaerota archaeon]
MRFSIVGCGQMGSWFARHLSARGASLTLHDKERRKAESLAKRFDARVIDSIEEAADSGPILLALPIKETSQALRDLVDFAEHKLRIVEICSFKGPLRKQISYARRGGHVVASIHPLFGPGQRDDKDTVTIHVDRGSRSEDFLVRMLLPKTRIRRMTWFEHDEAMTVAISLTHFIGISAAQQVSKIRPLKVKTKSLYTLLSLISISISESDSFYEDYAMNNSSAMKLFRAYAANVQTFLKALERSRATELVKEARKVLRRRYALDVIYNSLYSDSRNCR